MEDGPTIDCFEDRYTCQKNGANPGSFWLWNLSYFSDFTNRWHPSLENLCFLFLGSPQQPSRSQVDSGAGELFNRVGHREYLPWL